VRRAGQGGRSRSWRALAGRASFARELDPHFRVEEEWLFPPLAAVGEHALVERAVADHRRLRDLIGAAPGPGPAVELGELLHRHVRFEERELFPRAEGALDPATLEAAGGAALAARKQP
jgi:hemerythrin-like domain-containing protein